MSTFDLYNRRENRYGKYNAGVPGDMLSDSIPPAVVRETESSQTAQDTSQTPALSSPASADNEEAAMPQRDNYHFYTDLANTYLKKTMTPEEEERRKRSATAVEGIGHFGSVLNAFSNLVFTGQGAPSQTLPKVPAGNLQKFEDRVAENRSRYIGMLANAKGKDRAEWFDDWKNEYNRRKMDKEKELAQAELAYKRAQTNAANERAEYQRLINAGVPAKQAAELAYKKTQIDTQKAMQYKNYRQGKNAYKVVDSAMDKDGYYYTRPSKLTDNEARQIAQSSLGDKGLETFEEGAEFTHDGKKIKAGKVDWQAAAAYVIQKGELSREELEGRGFVLSGKRDSFNEDSGSQPTNRKRKSVPGYGSNNQGKTKVSGF
ncbi:hypothetical protein [uncultured Bacteroides sp.]|uniref:hypothetical protein n=1 Tax=uncultured Bacteroides sp. TaxID=162156 RepID=UPI002610037E|nr:hypothetical protein [uncultured Bacteroides sp.]